MASSPARVRPILRQRHRALSLAAAAILMSVVLPHPPAGATEGWEWPVASVRVVAGYRAPAHAYGPGHRGIDLEAAPESAVSSPAEGVIAFAGSVAGRPLVTIDHGSGLVTTLEPVSCALEAGTTVAAGEIVGEVAEGGHARTGSVHFGVRDHGEYINPLLLLGGVPRAVLLPCC